MNIFAFELLRRLTIRRFLKYLFPPSSSASALRIRNVDRHGLRPSSTLRLNVASVIRLFRVTGVWKVLMWQYMVPL